jgi:hypothetical protein
MKKPVEIDIGFRLNFHKLWALDVAVEEVETSELENNLDIPYLEKEGTDDWNLSIRELLSNQEKEITHATKMNKVDMSYPIDIYFFRGQWIIIDGVHRLARTINEGISTVMVRKIPRNLLITVKI